MHACHGHAVHTTRLVVVHEGSTCRLVQLAEKPVVDIALCFEGTVRIRS